SDDSLWEEITSWPPRVSGRLIVKDDGAQNSYMLIWAKTPAVDRYFIRGIIRFDTGENLFLDTQDGDAVFWTNVWRYLVVTWDGSVGRLYLDSNLEDSGSPTTSTTIEYGVGLPADMQLGSDGNTLEHRGNLDLVAFYGEAKDGVWIADQYANPGKTSNLQEDLGNGSVTGVSGKVIVSCASGIDCNWSAPNHNAPIAYANVGTYLPTPVGVIRFETRLEDLTKTGVDTLAGLTIWADRNNGIKFGHQTFTATSRILLAVIAGDIQTTIAFSGSVTEPSTTPHIYRIYWNPQDYPISIENGS
ncbi:unnamed protein product, partial [marine sediment metagenome]